MKLISSYKGVIFLVILVLLSGCSGIVVELPNIVSFSATSTTITAGESVTLIWQVSGADTVSIDQGIGEVDSISSISVNPTNTTIYTLTATNTAGSVTATTTVTVSSAATVTYNGNGHTAGIVPVDPASPYESGVTVPVLGNTGGLTRINDGGTSYYFTGWNPKADGSGTDQAEGSTFIMGASHVILYAQWKPYALRDTGPAGGYIFYDKGSYSDGWRYLEAAPVSIQWTGIQWGSYGTLIGGTETGIGAGQNNTITIVRWLNMHSETGRAAQLCCYLNLVVDGDVYTGWFLPSKDELNLMYENLKVHEVGGFADNFYWSSSEGTAFGTCGQRFDSGSWGYYFKDHTYRVRAVRAF